MEYLAATLVVLILFVCYLYFVETPKLYLLRLFVKVFYSFNINGEENFPKSGACIVIGNHVSYLDWLFLMIACPRRLHFVIYHTFYNSKLFSLILKKAEAIPISESHPKLIVKALAKVSEHLGKQQVVFVFPEGGIARTNEVQPFRPGVLRVRKKIKDCPVVPVFLDGLWGSFFSYSGGGVFCGKKLFGRRRKVTLRIGKPLSEEALPESLLFETVISLHSKDSKFYQET